MAEQEGKKIINSITKSTIFANLAVPLFRNSSDHVLWEGETQGKDFKHIFE